MQVEANLADLKEKYGSLDPGQLFAGAKVRWFASEGWRGMLAWLCACMDSIDRRGDETALTDMEAVVRARITIAAAHALQAGEGAAVRAGGEHGRGDVPAIPLLLLQGQGLPGHEGLSRSGGTSCAGIILCVMCGLISSF